MLAVATIATGCVPLSGGWDVASLRDRHPDVMHRAGQRLGDTPPYFILHRDSAVLFLCRFSRQEPVRVSLPVGATKSEASAIRVALDGWENAGLGVRFQEVIGESAMIEIHFAEPPTASRAVVVAVVGTGYTVSDCGFRSDLAGWDADGEAHEPLPAQLAGAIVHLRRSNTDMLGHEIMLGVDELVGVALHELGHALGFSGHVATPDSVMSKSTDTVRRFGRRLLAGDGFAAPSLAALYALSSGTVVGSAPVGEEEMAVFEAAKAFAESRNWRGPFVRVGESSANLNWRSGGSVVASLEVRDYYESLRSGTPLAFSAAPFERASRTSEHSAP